MLIAIVMTSLVALNPYVFGYLGKVMVDDVLEVGKGSTAAVSGDDSTSVEVGTEGTNTTPRGKTTQERLRLLLIIFLADISANLLAIFFSWIYQYNIAYIGQRIVFTLREQLHRKLQTLQMSFFDERQTGKIMARILDDVDVIQANATGTFSSIFADIMMLLIGAFIIFRLNQRLSLIAFATLPFYAISYRVFSHKIEENNKEIREKNSEVYGLVEEKISGVKVVKGFAQEMREVRGFFTCCGDPSLLLGKKTEWKKYCSKKKIF